MNAERLVREIEALMPEATQLDILRTAYLVGVDSGENELASTAHLPQLVQDVRLRWNRATEQFAAVSAELSSIGRLEAVRFSPQQLWVFIRSFKVHRQLLQLFTGVTTQYTPAT